MLPTILDISPTNCYDPDERSAVDMFYQLDHVAAESVILENPYRALKNLFWMGPTGLVFYFKDFHACLLTGKLNTAPSIIVDFMALAVEMARRTLPQCTLLELLLCIDHILDNEDVFSDGDRVDFKAIRRLRLLSESLHALLCLSDGEKRTK